MKKYWWGLPVVALSLVGVQQYNQDHLPENISRGIAQIEEETRVSSIIAESVREITALQQEIDQKIEKRELLLAERESINERLSTEALLEQDIFELDQQEVALTEEIDALSLEIDGLKQSQKLLTQELEDREKERGVVLCQAQNKTSKLEERIQELLKDKELVTERIITISKSSDKLNDEISDLRALVTGEDKSAPTVGNENGGQHSFDPNLLLQAITSLAHSLQFTLQQPNMGMMNFQPTATMQMPGMISSAMNQWQHNPIYYQVPYNYYTSPSERMNQGTFVNDWLQGSAAPQMRMMPQQPMMMPQQAPMMVPSAGRDVSSDASFFSF